MKCPYCQNADTRVIDSRPADEGTALRRRRQCENCEARFTTHERYQMTPLMVVKRDGRREEFSLEKLRGGLLKACSKRPVAMEQIDEAAATIERQLRNEGCVEVSVEQVGEKVMDRLFHLDQVAYVRFASVYQQFDDVKRFAQILEQLNRKRRQSRRRNVETPASDA